MYNTMQENITDFLTPYTRLRISGSRCVGCENIHIWCILFYSIVCVYVYSHAVGYISVLQCVAVCCSVLKCIAVCCSVLHHAVGYISLRHNLSLALSHIHKKHSHSHSLCQSLSLSLFLFFSVSLYLHATPVCRVRV